jgi:hypothetical protein
MFPEVGGVQAVQEQLGSGLEKKDQQEGQEEKIKLNHRNTGVKGSRAKYLAYLKWSVISGSRKESQLACNHEAHISP